MTSAEDGGAETTQYLILQGPDDGKCAVVTANSLNVMTKATIYRVFWFDVTQKVCIHQTEKLFNLSVSTCYE